MSDNAGAARQYDSLLLSRLSDDEYQILQPCLSVVQLSPKDVIYEPGVPIQHVYFPLSCTLSVLAFMRTGSAVEVATIGNEGFSGVDLIMGADAASNTYVCQIAGDSLRMRASDFKDALNASSALRNLTQRFLQGYMSQMAQSVACNRLHTVEERFARWLLITHDRAKGDTFYLTQEFMADMLGVHRPTVSLVAATYQQAGTIRYVRGHMTILDRQALEYASCECYNAVAAQYDRLLGIRRG